MLRPPPLGPRGEGWVVIQVPLFAIIAAAGLWLPGGRTGPIAGLGFVTGAILIVAGGLLAVAGAAALQHADALTALPLPRPSARLVDSGVFGLVRHPIYGGLILTAFGWAAVRASFATLCAAALLLAFFELKRRREEAWLEQQFPGYAAYRARTRQFIPWIV